MPDPGSPRYDEDEINLFEVLGTLWRGRLAILATAALPCLAGLGLVLTSPPLFKVQAAYSIRVAPMRAYDQICEHADCINSMVGNRALPLSMVDSGFVNTGSSFELTTEKPQPEGEYQKQLTEFNEIFRTAMLGEALLEKRLIENEFGNSALERGAVATNLLEANRIIYSLEEGGMPLSFEPISITETKKSFFLFAFAPAFVGALAGCVFVLFRKVFEDIHTKTGHIEH